MKLIYILFIVGSVVVVFLFFKKNNSQQMKDVITFSGTIEAIYLHEVPNKVEGKGPRIETRIELKLIEVYYEDIKRDLSEFNESIFIGKEELKGFYNIGNKVKITCNANMGRRIVKIEKLT